LAKVRVERAVTSTAHPDTSPDPTVSPLEDTLSDDAIEAELSRLLGASSRAGGSRSTIEVMDAISTANQEKSDLRRYLLIYEAVSELGRNDFEAALLRARKENNSIAQRAIERRWAEVDPLSAAKAWADGSEKLVGDSFFSSWVKINPSSALTWFTALEEGPQRQKARELILERVAKYDPQRALDFSNQITNEKDRNALVARALKTVAESDLPQAITLARSLPEGTTRDPEGATLWASTLPASDSRKGLLMMTVRNWQRTNPEAAQKWIDSAEGLSAAEKEALASLQATSKSGPSKVKTSAKPQKSK
jgi:hypothetical protein